MSSLKDQIGEESNFKKSEVPLEPTKVEMDHAQSQSLGERLQTPAGNIENISVAAAAPVKKQSRIS